MTTRRRVSSGDDDDEFRSFEPEEVHSHTQFRWARSQQQSEVEPNAGMRGRFELSYIVYPIEVLLRFWHHLNPRVYSERLRIRQITEGKIGKKGNRFALLVFYDHRSIPSFTQTVIDAIGRSGFNLVISTNASLSTQLRSDLQRGCHLLIERFDLGRDFGGYKDGISIIERRFGTPDRLMLLNDSLFFLEERLDELIAAFDTDDDLVALSEVFEHHYHLGSFALSLSRKVLENSSIKRYWRRYRPISTRRWSVHKGEVDFTKLLLRNGFSPRVLFHAARLRPHLLGLEGREFLQAVRLLPVALRGRLYLDYGEFQEEQRSTSLAAIGAFTRGARQFESPSDERNAELRGTAVRQLLTLNYDAATAHHQQERWAFDRLCREVVATIGLRNQIHVGGFLFHKYLGLPALKRDIFYREVFKLEEIETILRDLNEPLREAIMEDIRQKGCQAHFKGLKRILAKHGSL